MRIERRKVTLVGNAGVGKTSLVYRLVYGCFDRMEPTLGASYSTKILEDQDGHQYDIDLWDTAGQERYLSVIPLYFTNTDLFWLVFDLSEHESLSNLYYHVLNISRREDLKDAKAYVIGNKKDLIGDVKPTYSPVNNATRWNEEIEAIKKSFKSCRYFEVSAKTGENTQLILSDLLKDCPELGEKRPNCVSLEEEREKQEKASSRSRSKRKNDDDLNTNNDRDSNDGVFSESDYMPAGAYPEAARERREATSELLYRLCGSERKVLTEEEMQRSKRAWKEGLEMKSLSDASDKMLREERLAHDYSEKRVRFLLSPKRKGEKEKSLNQISQKLSAKERYKKQYEATFGRKMNDGEEELLDKALEENPGLIKEGFNMELLKRIHYCEANRMGNLEFLHRLTKPKKNNKMKSNSIQCEELNPGKGGDIEEQCVTRLED